MAIDLAIANLNSATVSILLNNGSGGFSAPTNVALAQGSSLLSLAIGDFNGDDQADLALGSVDFFGPGSGSVSILLGNGAGEFSAATVFTVQVQPDSMAAADFNADGKLDLAIGGNSSPNTVSILLGNGTGGFSAATDFAPGTSPFSMAIADFNGDGKPDLAVVEIASGTSKVSILLGDGSGGLSAATHFSAGTGPISVAVRDFNGDGNLDLAVANVSSDNVSILLGNGSGGFSAPTNFVAASPRSLAVSDFDGDGNLDLAAANLNANTVSILPGDGSGGFGAATSFAVGTNPLSVASGDFDDDGKPDLAVANANSNNVSVLLNSCPSVIVTAASGLTTTEFGGTGTFTMMLRSAPTADVTIGLYSSNTSEGTVLPSSVTFNSGNFHLPQTVTVTGVDDSLVEGPVGYTIVTTRARSMDARYDGINPSDVSVTNSDNDAGIIVAPAGGLITPQVGGTVTVPTSISTPPACETNYCVVIHLTSSDPGEGTVSPLTLTFTNENWNVEQAVTLTGVDEVGDDGVQGFTIVAEVVEGTPEYMALPPTNFPVINTGLDRPGVTITRAGNALGVMETTEEGGTASFTIVLDYQPTADVTIPLSSTEPNEGTVSSPASGSVTFTVSNWNQPQTVTVTGVDDLIADGHTAYRIVTHPDSSEHEYGGMNPDDVEVRNIDDEAPGITVLSNSRLTTSEAGGTATFMIALLLQPSGDVTIGLTSSNTSEGTVSPSSVTFDSDNYNVPQTVTAAGVDDAVSDGDRLYTISTAAATSSDAGYNGFNAVDVSVLNIDNDPGLAAIGDMSVAENAALNFTISATDADNNALTFSATNLPSGAAFDAGTRTFSWTPSFTQAGTYNNVTFSVSDSDGNTVSEQITILVINTNRNPVLAAIGDQSVAENATLTFTVAATDADGQTVTYAVANAPVGASLDAAGGAFRWTPTSSQRGVHSGIIISASDGSGTDSKTITINVTNTVASAATSTITASSPAYTQGVFTSTITVQAKDAGGTSLTTRGDTVALLTTIGTMSDVTDNGNGTYVSVLTSSSPGSASVTGTLNGATVASNAVVVMKATTSILLTSSANPSTSGQSVTFTATLTSQSSGTITGNVTFFDGTAAIGTVAVSGGTASLATSSLPTGPHSIKGVFDGNTTWQTSTSPVVSQNVVSASGAPSFVSATATSVSSVTVVWAGVSGATGYQILRATGGGGFVLAGTTATMQFDDAGLSGGRTYLYKVRAVTSGGASEFSAVDVATTVIFTDAVLSGVASKAIHISELRTAVAAVRVAAGLGAATYTNAIVRGARIRASDITELRAALDGARAALRLASVVYTDLSLGAGTSVVKAAHIANLRGGVQ